MANRRLYMETTSVETSKTAGQVGELLAECRAKRIMHDLEDGQIVGLTFSILVGDKEVAFNLPIKPDSIFEIINGRRALMNQEQMEDQDREQALRVAWRQIYRWILAQVALIETGMVKPEEVFLPYLRLGDGGTLYQRIEGNGFQKALPKLD